MNWNELIDKVTVYLDENNIDFSPENDIIGWSAYGKVSLKKTENTFEIESWNYEIPKPTKQQLNAISASQVEKVRNKKEKKRLLQNVYQLPFLSVAEVAQLQGKVPKGSLYIDEMTQQIKFFK